MVGKTISHYKILEKLGGGGMGVVYQAKDTKLDRFVALKFLSPHLAGDEEDKKRFIQEAKAASALDHNNICTIHEINETEDGQLFIAMAYYDGETLKKKIERGPLKIEEALDVASQVGEGLAKAHKQDIVHRDIKPANIMITNDGVAKIVDFGLAKLTGQTKLTRTGETFGTISYMSPEQARGDEVDHRTDIWSLGVVLYEMITGILPFKGEYDQAVIYSILNKTPMRVSKIVLNIPRQLDSIIFKTLEKNPTDRFLQAKEFQAGLTEVKSTLSSSPARPKTFQKSVRDFFSPLPWISVRSKLKERKVALIMSGLAALLLMLALFNRSVDMAQSDNKISVAVMPFENNTGDSELEWLSNGIPDMLVTNLSRSRYLNLIGLDRIARVLSKMEQENIREVDLFEEFTRRIRAQFIIKGRAIQSKSKLRIMAQVYNVHPGGQMKPVQVEKEGLDNIMRIADQLSDQIRVTLEVEAEGTPEIAENIFKAKTNSIEAYRHYIRGRDNKVAKHHKEAVLNLTKAIQIDSSFVHAYEELSHVNWLMGEDSLALESIRKALKYSSNLTDVEQYRLLHQEAQVTRNYDLVEKYLRYLAVLQPDKPEWHYQLAWYYGTHKRLCEQSIRKYEIAVALDSISEPDFYYHLGYTYLKCGEPEEAISVVKKYVSLLPDEAISHNRLGFAYIMIGEYDLAYKQFNLAQKLQPGFTETLLNLGMFYNSIGKNKEAIKYYEMYLRQTIGKKQEEVGYFYLSKLYFENSKLDEAFTKIEYAISLNPNWVDCHWLLGLIQLGKGNIDSAKATCTKMEAIQTALHSEYGIEFIYHLKGKIHEAAGEFDLAIGQFQKAITVGNLNQAYFRNALAEVYLKKGDLNQAIQFYKNVFKINSNYIYSYYGLGQAYEKKNELVKAISAYETCLQIWKDADEDNSLIMDVKSKLLALKRTL